MYDRRALPNWYKAGPPCLFLLQHICSRSRTLSHLQPAAIMQRLCAFPRALQSKRTSVTLLNDYVVLGSLGKGAYGEGLLLPCCAV